MTDTPASTEAETPAQVAVTLFPHGPGCGQWSSDDGRGGTRCVCDEQTHRNRILALRAANATAPDPAPRVLVDEADLRAVPLRDRLTEQEREWLDTDLRRGHHEADAPPLVEWWAARNHLRDSLSAASPGGKQ